MNELMNELVTEKMKDNRNWKEGQAISMIICSGRSSNLLINQHNSPGSTFFHSSEGSKMPVASFIKSTGSTVQATHT